MKRGRGSGGSGEGDEDGTGGGGRRRPGLSSTSALVPEALSSLACARPRCAPALELTGQRRLGVRTRGGGGGSICPARRRSTPSPDQRGAARLDTTLLVARLLDRLCT
uniref:Uncharacterized protein n=1 Tax=Oryza barthii TaxID=65489 RepID=A0A0D3FCT8_9ORYZ